MEPVRLSFPAFRGNCNPIGASGPQQPEQNPLLNCEATALTLHVGSQQCRKKVNECVRLSDKAYIYVMVFAFLTA
jgi:hypothetical protein